MPVIRPARLYSRKTDRLLCGSTLPLFVGKEKAFFQSIRIDGDNML